MRIPYDDLIVSRRRQRNPHIKIATLIITRNTHIIKRNTHLKKATPYFAFDVTILGLEHQTL